MIHDLLVVIGKGGVGRSTVAAALAVHAAASGSRVLLIDAVAGGGAALALGVTDLPPAGEVVNLGAIDSASGRSLAGISLLELSTEAALDEYVRLNLKVPIAPRSLGPIARMFDYVATAAPAVREILTIGKIGHEVRRGNWDTVIVDAPATGHVIELLSAPKALGELVGFGPLASESAWLGELLAEEATTAAVAVTIAEDLPVTETIELLARLEDETDVALGGLVVNRLAPHIEGAGEAEAETLIEGGKALATFAAVALDRSRVGNREQTRLAELDLNTIRVAEDLDDPVGAVLEAIEAGGW